MNKIHNKSVVYFVGYFYIMDMINAWTMEHIEMLTVVKQARKVSSDREQ